MTSENTELKFKTKIGCLKHNRLKSQGKKMEDRKVRRSEERNLTAMGEGRIAGGGCFRLECYKFQVQGVRRGNLIHRSFCGSSVEGEGFFPFK